MAKRRRHSLQWVRCPWHVPGIQPTFRPRWWCPEPSLDKGAHTDKVWALNKGVLLLSERLRSYEPHSETDSTLTHWKGSHIHLSCSHFLLSCNPCRKDNILGIVQWSGFSNDVMTNGHHSFPPEGVKGLCTRAFFVQCILTQWTELKKERLIGNEDNVNVLTLTLHVTWILQHPNKESESSSLKKKGSYMNSWNSTSSWDRKKTFTWEKV